MNNKKFQDNNGRWILTKSSEIVYTSGKKKQENKKQENKKGEMNGQQIHISEQ